MAGADEPTELHLARVGDGERSHDYKERDQRERPGVEAGAVAVPAQARAAGLDELCFGWRVMTR